MVLFAFEFRLFCVGKSMGFFPAGKEGCVGFVEDLWVLFYERFLSTSAEVFFCPAGGGFRFSPIARESGRGAGGEGVSCRLQRSFFVP